MAGEVFIRGDQPLVLHARHHFLCQTRNGILIIAEGANVNHRVERVGVDIHDRGKVGIDMQRAHILGHQLALFNGELFIRAPFNRRRQRHIAGE